MRDVAIVLLKNNTGIKKTVKNPQKSFKIEYVVDGRKIKKTYKYDRNKTIVLRLGLFKSRCSFYEEGNPEPLSPKFEPAGVDMKEISAIVETDLFSQLVSSTKDKAMQMSIGLVLGLAGIGAIVLIAILG